VALNVADYSRESRSLTVHHSKGNKARIVYISNGAKAALDAWLDQRGSHAGPLFLRILRGGTSLPVGKPIRP
jgi:integrase